VPQTKEEVGSQTSPKKVMLLQERSGMRLEAREGGGPSSLLERKILIKKRGIQMKLAKFPQIIEILTLQT